MLPETLKQQLGVIRTLIEMGRKNEAIAIERGLRKDNPDLSLPSVPCEVTLDKFITKDTYMLTMKDHVRMLALVNDPVFIQGETGVGKEIIAEALHGSRLGKFVAINCTSLPDYLLESELFGHKKGAFTGANEDKVGLFVYAQNGTVFLDEIGDMPPALQAKLLRAIQSKKVRPVGANDEVEINCRILSASNRDIKDLALKEKKFRSDLYYRLGVFSLYISPLRQRPDDIPMICEFYGCMDSNAQQSLKALTLQGNVRELQSYIRRLKVLGQF